MAYSNELVAECMQDEPAFCTAVCPFNIDVRDFIAKIQQGRFNAAYKSYQNAVGFPGIVAALCNEPCGEACILKGCGGAISVRMLEKAAIDFARNTDPDQYNIPAKDKKVAIIGGGISGLACALRLASKNYNVSVFERTGRTGGHLNELMEPELVRVEIEKQFRYENFSLVSNCEVKSLDDLEFDSAFIATGKEGYSFGYGSARDGVFVGGSITGADTMHAIAQGLNASTAIENYLKTGKTAEVPIAGGTKLTKDAVRLKETIPVVPFNGRSFSKEEAIEEARRCIKCNCDACVYYSPLLNYFQKFPRRITEEVEVTIHPGTLDGAGTVATRLISTCNHCGLCKEVCPKDIDTGEFLLRSHRAMREKGAMPWAFHEYYLRDMEFSDGEAFVLKPPPGGRKSKFMFFPGCQLGASDPWYVMSSYKFLIENYPETALMAGCCGAPAEWAGDVEMHSRAVEKIKSSWIKLGKPVVLMACPTCRQMFREYLPELECRFIYEMIAEKGFEPSGSFTGITASIFDPCASRHEPDLQKTIRELATKAGFKLEALPMEGKMAECCSFGGQVAIAHPPYAENMTDKVVNRSSNPYIAYCSNCRDIFVSAGKQTWHILDIVFGPSPGKKSEPTITERRSNRLLLKEKILKEFWKEDISMKEPTNKMHVKPDLREKLNRAMILETDMLAVIEHCESTGSKIFDPAKGSFFGHLQIGNMTYWVEYRIDAASGYELINGYCHRMKIEES